MPSRGHMLPCGELAPWALGTGPARQRVDVSACDGLLDARANDVSNQLL